MSLSRSFTPCLKRPRTFALPLRPACAAQARRAYASQRPSTVSPSSTAEPEPSQPSTSDDSPTVKEELAPSKPKKLSGDEFLAKASHTLAHRDTLLSVDTQRRQEAGETPARGTLSTSSIFNDEAHTEESKEDPDTAVPAALATAAQGAPTFRNFSAMQAFMTPRPASTQRWLRKMVARRVRRRGQLTETELRKRTERELRATSEFWKTSIKKLAPLARLIAGKPLEDALVQMRFSKKKTARKIYSFLVATRDRAVVERGMSLGQDLESPLKITLKDGKKRSIENPTGIYVDQAWVGQGPYGKSPKYRARGRMEILRHPTTSFSVLLKEEKTRIREHNDRQDRELARKPWIQMPNRPITAQRPYYSW